MKKIAFIMPSPFTYGGEQRVVSVVASLLCKAGYDVSIICTMKAEEDYSLYDLNKNIKIVNLPEIINDREATIQRVHDKLIRVNANRGILRNFPRIQEKLYSVPTFKRRLIKKINEEKYDYVIGVASYYNVLLASIKKKISAKIIGWQHSCYEAYFEKPGRRLYNADKMFKRIQSRFSEYVVLMNYDKEKIDKRFNMNCTQIFNPCSFRDTGKCNLKSHVFLSYGRFQNMKGYDLLLDAYSQYKKGGGTWKLQLVGDGEARESIVNDIKKRKLKRDVLLDGFTNNVRQYIEKSSVLLFPSRWEGCSMTFNESLQSGLPIIAFDLNNFIEVTEGYESAILVPQFDTTEFAKQMLRVEKDEKLLKHMSAEAYRNLEVLNDDVIVSKWKKILK